MNKTKKLARTLTLDRETLRSLATDDLAQAAGGNLATVVIFSFAYCGSRNGCGTLDCGGPTPTVGCPRNTTLG